VTAIAHHQADYFAQLQIEMVRVLPTRSMREKEAFAALRIDEQAWRFMNWQSRLVHPHPRQVNKADGFDRLPTVLDNQREVEELIANIAQGDDVTGYLSEDIKQGYCLHPPGRKDGKDFDLLLNEWGIHHLHIDPASGKAGFKKRSKELLYTIFGQGVAFILAVAPHGGWTSRQLIETTVKSWPNQGLFVALNVLPGRDWTEDEHKGLRKAGVTTAAVVNDKPWISGITLGLSSALVSVRISKETSRILRSVNQAAEYPEHLARQLMEYAAANDISWPARPVINIRWFKGPDRFCFGFVEEASEAIVLI
jgi:hypothetical protein